MAATITLSGVERVSVQQHLERCHARCARGDPDAVALNGILVRIGEDKTVTLATLEIFLLLRCLRARHHELDDDMMQLEERRLRGGHNGQLDAAHRILDAEAQILADVLRRLWQML